MNFYACKGLTSLQTMTPIPVAARSKVGARGSSLPGIMGSKPAGGMWPGVSCV